MQSPSSSSSKGKNHSSCCLRGCFNSYYSTLNKVPKVTFHAIPSRPYDASRKELWIQFVRKANGEDWYPKSRYHRICSEHFFENKPFNHPKHPGYAPTIYPEDPKFRRRYRKRQIVPKENQIALKQLSEKQVALPVEPVKPQKTNYNHQLSDEDDDDDFCFDDFVETIHFDDSMSDEEPPSPELPKYREVSTQTEPNPTFDLTNRPYVQMNIFTSSQTGSGDASTQVEHESKFGKQTDRSVGNGPEIPAFHGFTSIEEHSEQDEVLKHLALIDLNTFSKLNQILVDGGFKPRAGVRTEDLLLLSLIKLKHSDLPFLGLSILFNVKRTTIRQNFDNILSRLSKALNSESKSPELCDILDKINSSLLNRKSDKEK